MVNIHKAYDIRVGLFVESLISDPSAQWDRTAEEEEKIKKEEYGSGKDVQKMERYKEREESVSHKLNMKQGVKQRISYTCIHWQEYEIFWAWEKKCFFKSV